MHRFEKRQYYYNAGRYEALMPVSEQIPGEMFSLRDRIKGYVLDVKKKYQGIAELLFPERKIFIANIKDKKR